MVKIKELSIVPDKIKYNLLLYQNQKQNSRIHELRIAVSCIARKLKSRFYIKRLYNKSLLRQERNFDRLTALYPSKKIQCEFGGEYKNRTTAKTARKSLKLREKALHFGKCARKLYQKNCSLERALTAKKRRIIGLLISNKNIRHEHSLAKRALSEASEARLISEGVLEKISAHPDCPPSKPSPKPTIKLVETAFEADKTSPSESLACESCGCKCGKPGCYVTAKAQLATSPQPFSAIRAKALSARPLPRLGGEEEGIGWKENNGNHMHEKGETHSENHNNKEMTSEQKECDILWENPAERDTRLAGELEELMEKFYKKNQSIALEAVKTFNQYAEENTMLVQQNEKLQTELESLRKEKEKMSQENSNLKGKVEKLKRWGRKMEEFVEGVKLRNLDKMDGKVACSRLKNVTDVINKESSLLLALYEKHFPDDAASESTAEPKRGTGSGRDTAGDTEEKIQEDCLDMTKRKTQRNQKGTPAYSKNADEKEKKRRQRWSSEAKNNKKLKYIEKVARKIEKLPKADFLVRNLELLAEVKLVSHVEDSVLVQFCNRMLVRENELIKTDMKEMEQECFEMFKIFKAKIASKDAFNENLINELTTIEDQYADSLRKCDLLLKELAEKNQQNLELVNESSDLIFKTRLLQEKNKETDEKAKKLKEIEQKNAENLSKLHKNINIVTKKYREYALKCVNLSQANDATKIQLAFFKDKLNRVLEEGTKRFEDAKNRIESAARPPQIENLGDSSSERIVRPAQFDEARLVNDKNLINLKVELKHMRRKLICPVCNTRERNTVLVKCFHVFCDICASQNISSRMRKCPICKKPCGKESFREIYF